MKKYGLFLMTLVLSMTIYAQRNKEGNYWNTWEYSVKPGMEKDFEKAVAKKTAMFNKTPETAIRTYRVINGPDFGKYLRVEGNKSPADYDLDRSEEGKYWAENVSKFLVKEEGQIRYELIKDGSYSPKTDSPTYHKYVERTTFNVKADKIMHFRRAMSRVAQVAEKRGWDGSRTLYRVVSGGNRNQFVLAIGFDTYNRPDKPEGETTFKEDYDKLFGWGSLDEDWGNFDASLEYWGEQVDMLQLIPEMSTGMMK